MCGIAGFFASARMIDASSGRKILSQMTDAIAHRGPDADGSWYDDAQGIFLGHRRLSILDLSPAGAQPMTSHDGRYVMVFNGEIYNAPDLAAHLRMKYSGLVFNGHSDTEILLEGFARFGVEDILPRIKGMFALALWDRLEQSLYLMRDHLGKKPLYYGRIGGHFVFGSELKSLKVFAKSVGAALEIDRRALGAYTSYGFVPSPRSIYEGISKLPPAHYLRIGDETMVEKAYWTLDYHAPKLPYDPQKLKSLLQEAVKGRMMSDVPLGAFLSGGIDSSLVVALMQEQSAANVKTYSIGFDDLAFDESKHAENVARHLGCDHTTYHVSAADTLGVIPNLAHIYDEPFADYSQIPSIVLCQKARKDTVVALSGDGGDEFFCGYARYFMLQKLQNLKRKVPHGLHGAVASILSIPHQGIYNALGMNGKRMHSIAGQFSEKSFRGEVLRTLSMNPRASLLVGMETDLPELDAIFEDETLSDLEKMMLVDTLFYLPDDILVKVDRASMAASLEVRSPLLDKDVIEYAWSIRLDDKLRGHSAGKKPLYDLLCTYVPEEMINRPKQGFSPPIASWLRGDLKDWARDLLAADTGLYDRVQMQKLWSEFESGRADHHNALWAVLMAQSWFLTNRDQ